MKPGTTILYYAKPRNEAGVRLRKAVEEAAGKEGIETCVTIQELFRRLCRPRMGIAATVLFAVDKGELFQFMMLGDMLHEVPLIFILPDNEEETVSLGHSLYPRLISYGNSDFADVAAVLKRKVAQGEGRA